VEGVWGTGNRTPLNRHVDCVPFCDSGRRSLCVIAVLILDRGFMGVLMVGFLFAVILLAVVVSELLKPRSSSTGAWPMSSVPVLTQREQPLFWRLQKALPDHVVLAQVQLSRMMRVKRTDKWRTWQNKIERKSADFVVCNKDFSVAAVIELDDSSHDRPDRRKSDADKDAALGGAGIRIIRWRSLPSDADIRAAVVPVSTEASIVAVR
jgi:very-short-patch-repair endonuclease